MNKKHNIQLQALYCTECDDILRHIIKKRSVRCIKCGRVGWIKGDAG